MIYRQFALQITCEEDVTDTTTWPELARANGWSIFNTFVFFSMLWSLVIRANLKNAFLKGIYLKILLKYDCYLIFKQEIQIWPDVSVKKVHMHCNKMKTCTEAYYMYPHKITKPTIFS